MKYLARIRIEKRKDFETKASLVITDVYKKHMFRKQLSRAIKDRKKVIVALSNYALITRLRKYYICYTSAKMLVDKAFNLAKARAEDQSVKTVQRMFRGF